MLLRRGEAPVPDEGAAPIDLDQPALCVLDVLGVPQHGQSADGVPAAVGGLETRNASAKSKKLKAAAARKRRRAAPSSSDEYEDENDEEWVASGSD